MFISLGVIGENGEFRFPVTPLLAIGESFMNLSPYIVGGLLVYNGVKAGAKSILTTLSFIASGVLLMSITSLVIAELLTTQSLSSSEFTSIRLPIIVALTASVVVIGVFMAKNRKNS